MTSDGLRAAVLGPVSVASGDKRIELTGANARALVAALVLAAGSARSADALVDDIWGDEPPRNPRAALQTLVSRVRAAAGSDAVRSLPGGYALGDVETDLAVASHLLDAAANPAHAATHPAPAAANRGHAPAPAAANPGHAPAPAAAKSALAPDPAHAPAPAATRTAASGAPTPATDPIPATDPAPATAPAPAADPTPATDSTLANPPHPADPLTLLDDAAALWRGEPGADLEPAPIAAAVRDAATALRSRLDAARADALRAAGRYDEAVAALESRAGAHPYDEAAHAQLMGALADAGRAAEALNVFAALRGRLRDDLGADPGDEISRLNATLLRGAAAPTRVRIGLQAAPNELLGRADDLAAIAGLLREARVVTILGTGGLGKTRLAQAAAADSDAPAVVVVPLAGVRNDDDVAPTIATVLGISEASSEGRLADIRMRPDLRARVVGLLTEQTTLIVLDNCEQVIDGVAAWVTDMLAAVPSLRALTTSRTPVAVAGEAVYPLAPLALQDAAAPAVQLFIERARAVRPGATLPLEVVERLCTHLDGLPLAIELAAARVRTMTPQQIEQRLQDRFALLTTGDRSAPERHRTLEAVIGWSWDLLDEQARRAMTVLAVLPDGFGAEAAAVVLGEPVDDVIDRLVSQSLLLVTEGRTGEVRFRMLETIREYALARLADDAGGIDAAWDRITVWAWRFSIDRLDRVFDRTTHAQIRAEHANLIAVLRHAIDSDDHETTVLLFALLAQTWMVMGAFTEMTSFAPAAFAAVAKTREGRVPVEALVATLIVGTFVAQAEGGAGALRLVARMRALRRRHPDMDDRIGAFADAVVDILAAVAGGEVSAVYDALERMRTSSKPATRLVGETLMSQFAENEGLPELAMSSARRSWELAGGAGSEWFAAMAAASVAQLASQTGQSALALEWLARADDLYESFGAAQQQHQLVWLRAANLLASGDIERARTLFTTLSASNELTEDGLATACIGVYGLAEIARAEGDRDAAADGFAQALRMFSSEPQRGSPWYQMMIAGGLSAAVFDELHSPEWRRHWARRLRTRTLAIMREPQPLGVADHPVLGTVLIGWSAWALQETDDTVRDRGLEALALGERLAARQDLKSLHWDEHAEHATRLVGAERLAAARGAVSTLSHEDLLPRSLEVLRERRPAP